MIVDRIDNASKRLTKISSSFHKPPNDNNSSKRSTKNEFRTESGNFKVKCFDRYLEVDKIDESAIKIEN